MVVATTMYETLGARPIVLPDRREAPVLREVSV
jgi:hypothetical protein